MDNLKKSTDAWKRLKHRAQERRYANRTDARFGFDRYRVSAGTVSAHRQNVQGRIARRVQA